MVNTNTGEISTGTWKNILSKEKEESRGTADGTKEGLNGVSGTKPESLNG